jgi:hypothetical protein
VPVAHPGDVERVAQFPGAGSDLLDGKARGDADQVCGGVGEVIRGHITVRRPQRDRDGIRLLDRNLPRSDRRADLREPGVGIHRQQGAHPHHGDGVTLGGVRDMLHEILGVAHSLALREPAEPQLGAGAVSDLGGERSLLGGDRPSHLGQLERPRDERVVTERGRIGLQQFGGGCHGRTGHASIFPTFERMY